MSYRIAFISNTVTEQPLINKIKRQKNQAKMNEHNTCYWQCSVFKAWSSVKACSYAKVRVENKEICYSNAHKIIYCSWKCSEIVQKHEKLFLVKGHVKAVQTEHGVTCIRYLSLTSASCSLSFITNNNIHREMWKSSFESKRKDMSTLQSSVPDACIKKGSKM